MLEHPYGSSMTRFMLLTSPVAIIGLTIDVLPSSQDQYGAAQIPSIKRFQQYLPYLRSKIEYASCLADFVSSATKFENELIVGKGP